MGNGDVPYFQHSASATGGSSGGAVYNDSGELIGTISGGMRGVNVTLSVPISKTKELLKKIGLEKIYQ
jgi:S1-C subfamily serine protease